MKKQNKVQTSVEERHAQMTQTKIPELVIRLAIPTVISQLITVIYNTADTYFVSHLGKSATASVGVIFSFMSIIQAVGYSIGMGGSSLVSLRLGEKKNDEADMFASSAFYFAIAIGTLLMVAGLCFPVSIVKLIGATDTMMPYALAYARYIFISTPIMCAAFVLNILLRAEGESTQAMIGLCAGGILNIALDPLLIYTFNMGVAGAALATAISQAVSFLILIGYFVGNRSVVKLKLELVSKKASDYANIISTGLPTLFRQGLASVSSALINIKAGIYGDAAIAAVTIANKIYLLLRHIILGIGQGFQPVAGYNYGARKYDRVKKAFWVTTAYGTVVCVLGCALILKNPSALVKWFVDDSEVIGYSTAALLYACYVMPVMAYSTYVNQLYQAIGYKTMATILAMCRQGIMFIPLILLLPPVIGFAGVQVAQPGADALTFLVCVPAQIVCMRKLDRLGSNEKGS